MKNNFKLSTALLKFCFKIFKDSKTLFAKLKKKGSKTTTKSKIKSNKLKNLSKTKSPLIIIAKASLKISTKSSKILTNTNTIPSTTTPKLLKQWNFASKFLNTVTLTKKT